MGKLDSDSKTVKHPKLGTLFRCCENMELDAGTNGDNIVLRCQNCGLYTTHAIPEDLKRLVDDLPYVRKCLRSTWNLRVLRHKEHEALKQELSLWHFKADSIPTN